MADCVMKMVVLLVACASSVEAEMFAVTSPVVNGHDLVLQCTVQHTRAWSVHISKLGENRTILDISSNCTYRSLTLAGTYKYTCGWTLDDAVVSLFVKHARRDTDYGTWVCEFEKGKLEVTILQEDYKVPTKRATLMDLPKLYEETKYHLVCVTSASYPPAEVTWHYRSDNKDRELHISGTVHSVTHNNNLYVTTSRLPYTMTRGDNSNSIYCTASNGFHNVSSQLKNLDVRYPAEVRIMYSVNPYTVWESTVLFLKCEFIDGNPGPSSVEWYKDSVLIGNNFIYRKTRSRADDEGNYTCVVTNDNAFPAAVASKTVYVLYEPRVEVPGRYEVLEGSNVKTNCVIKNHPLYPMTGPVIWTRVRRDGSTIKVNQDGAVMVINRIRRDQAGQYVCSIESTLVDSSRNQRTIYGSGIMIIDVLYPPVVRLPSRWGVEELSTLNISCTATGNPSVTPEEYRWRGPNNFTAATHKLVIETITRDQAGNYTCIVTKRLSSDVIASKTFKEQQTMYVDVQYSPTIQLPNTTLEIKENGILRIACDAHANPPPQTIRWIFPDGAVVPSDRVSLPNIQQHQGGKYKCEAINRLKIANDSAKVRISSKSIWIVVLPASTPVSTTTSTTVLDGHTAQSGMTPASLIGIGVVIGAVVVLVVVCVVVLFKRRKTSKQGRVNKSDFADTTIRYKTRAKLSSGNDITHTNGERHNSYADITYVDGGYLNPALVLSSGAQVGNLYTESPDGGYLNPTPTYSDSPDGGYLNPTHDVSSVVRKVNTYIDCPDGGYLNPTHDVTSDTRKENTYIDSPDGGYATPDHDVTFEINKSIGYTDPIDGEYLNPIHDVTCEDNEGHTYAEPQDGGLKISNNFTELRVQNHHNSSANQTHGMKPSKTLPHDEYIQPRAELNQHIYEEPQ